jgi:ParB family transcriptional regulator, chromosome partitioning protein
MSRHGLGRGLSAIIPDEIRAPRQTRTRDALRMIRTDHVRPDPSRPRINFHIHVLEELAEKIRNEGVGTPLLVRRDEQFEGHFVLIAGERRLQASVLAGLDEVPCWVRDNIDSREQLEQALIENLHRDDLDPIEVAETYHRLVHEFDRTQADVARSVGKDRATVANAIRLLKLPDFAVTALRDGRISAGHGKALLALGDPDLLRAALTEVLDQTLSVRATERLVSARLTTKERRKRGPSPVISKLSARIGRELNANVRVETSARSQRGRILIDFSSQEELDRLVRQLTE